MGASNYFMEAVLSQLDDNECEGTAAFFCQKLLPRELMEKECLAI